MLEHIAINMIGSMWGVRLMTGRGACTFEVQIKVLISTRRVRQGTGISPSKTK